MRQSKNPDIRSDLTPLIIISTLAVMTSCHLSEGHPSQRHSRVLPLNDDVNQYLTNFQLNTAEYHKPVTIAHLLTHTAGIESVFLGSEVKSEADIVSMHDYFARHTPAVISPPGDFISYSNHGMALAGLVVQEVSKIRFEDYVKKYIFNPLGMQNSVFELVSGDTDNLATSYLLKGEKLYFFT